MCWLAWGSLSWYFWQTWHPCEPKQTPLTRLHHGFIIIVRLGVIPSAFAWVIASSGTYGSLWLWISCYSWWLLLPRRLGAAEEHWYELVIVRGHLPVIVKGLVPFPVESQNVTLVNCSCHWVTSLVGRFLRCPIEDEVRATSLSHRTTKWWSTQQELACQQAHEPREKNHCVHLLWLIGFLPMIGLYYIGWFICLYTSVQKFTHTPLHSCKLE